MSRKKIDDSIRRKVIRDYDAGISRIKIAEKYGISRSSVGRIVRNNIPKRDRQNKETDKDRKERQRRIENLEKRILDLEKKILEMEKRRK